MPNDLICHDKYLRLTSGIRHRCSKYSAVFECILGVAQTKYVGPMYLRDILTRLDVCSDSEAQTANTQTQTHTHTHTHTQRDIN